MTAPRLLSFLTQIEKALANIGCEAASKSGSQRVVNFHKGICRLAFPDGAGSIVLQSYVLADGQSCLKAVLSWRGSNEVSHEAVYPQGDFNWTLAADRIAEIWNAGPTAAPKSAESSNIDLDAIQAAIGSDRYANAG